MANLYETFLSHAGEMIDIFSYDDDFTDAYRLMRSSYVSYNLAVSSIVFGMIEGLYSQGFKDRNAMFLRIKKATENESGGDLDLYYQYLFSGVEGYNQYITNRFITALKRDVGDTPSIDEIVSYFRSLVQTDAQ